MRRISSKGTFFIKRVFPVIWFGIVGGIMAVAIFAAVNNNAWIGVLIVVVFGIFMVGGGFLVMKLLVFDLVDEVWDEGDHLIVKNGKQEERIPLTAIMNVNYVRWSNPERITLTLRGPCCFGSEVTFSPPGRFNPYKRSPIVQELIERVDAARREE